MRHSIVIGELIPTSEMLPNGYSGAIALGNKFEWKINQTSPIWDAPRCVPGDQICSWHKMDYPNLWDAPKWIPRGYCLGEEIYLGINQNHSNL